MKQFKSAHDALILQSLIQGQRDPQDDEEAFILEYTQHLNTFGDSQEKIWDSLQFIIEYKNVFDAGLDVKAGLIHMNFITGGNYFNSRYKINGVTQDIHTLHNLPTNFTLEDIYKSFKAFGATGLPNQLHSLYVPDFQKSESESATTLAVPNSSGFTKTNLVSRLHWRTQNPQLAFVTTQFA